LRLLLHDCAPQKSSERAFPDGRRRAACVQHCFWHTSGVALSQKMCCLRAFNVEKPRARGEGRSAFWVLLFAAAAVGCGERV